MKTTYGTNIAHLFFEWCGKAKNALAASFLFVAYHWYDAVCLTVSNEFSLAWALAIMTTILFVVSILLLFLHQTIGAKYGWDVLGLDELNALKDVNLPRRHFWKRFLRFTMRRTQLLYWVGSITVGPPIVALLLRKDKRWVPMLVRYVIPGTLISVFFWVFFWKGIGALTWEQYLKPFYKNLIG